MTPSPLPTLALTLTPVHRHPCPMCRSGIPFWARTSTFSFGGLFTWSPQNVAQGTLIRLLQQHQAPKEGVVPGAAWGPQEAQGAGGLGGLTWKMAPCATHAWAKASLDVRLGVGGLAEALACGSGVEKQVSGQAWEGGDVHTWAP